MKEILKFICTAFMLIVSGIAEANTAFIKYKNYLIPVTKTCDKPKVIVSTDIRPLGTEEDDDTQSMVHYLVSSYRFNTVGLISSPGGGSGSADSIRWVIDNYERDRSSLIGTTGRDYPIAKDNDPATQDLYSVVVQGNKGTKFVLGPKEPNPQGDGYITYNSNDPNHKGAKLIRDEVSKIVYGGECGPIYVLTWGGISDISIALRGNDTTETLTNAQVARNIRVFSIGGLNTPDTGPYRVFWNWLQSTYLANDELWFIHSDSTFRGIYQNAPEQQRIDFKNKLNTFGCLGWVLSQTQTNEVLKIGDTSSVLYLMNGDSNDPTGPSWGGQFKLVDSNHSQYWSDGIGQPSVTPHGTVSPNGIPTPPNTIYGAWYEDMRRASGNGCIAEPKP